MSANEQRDEYTPHPSAIAAGDLCAQQLFEANGNPETMTLDRVGLSRALAYGIDCAVKGAGVNWK